jgi:hypothetical protein
MYNVRPCVAGRRGHPPTQQTQQPARGIQTLGIAALSCKFYPRLDSSRNTFCLPRNTTIWYKRQATAWLWLAVSAEKAYASC